MIDTVAGAVVAPRPSPMGTIWPTITAYGVSTSTLSAIQANELASSSRPARTMAAPTAVVPTRSTILGASNDAAAIETATGSVRTPASTGP